MFKTFWMLVLPDPARDSSREATVFVHAFQDHCNYLVRHVKIGSVTEPGVACAVTLTRKFPNPGNDVCVGRSLLPQAVCASTHAEQATPKKRKVVLRLVREVLLNSKPTVRPAALLRWPLVVLEVLLFLLCLGVFAQQVWPRHWQPLVVFVSFHGTTSSVKSQGLSSLATNQSYVSIRRSIES